MTSIAKILSSFFITKSNFLFAAAFVYNDKLIPNSALKSDISFTDINTALTAGGVGVNATDIAQGKTILGVAGTFTSDANAISGNLVKDKTDNPSIGLLLCKTKDKFTAEYALKDINKPIGVSEYKLLEDIPEYLQSQLPKAEDIELHIQDIEDEGE